MEKLLKVYGELFPVMAFVVVGYVAARTTKLKSETISKPLIHVLLPLLVFSNMLDADVAKLAILPATTFALALLMNYLALILQRTIAPQTNPLILRSSFSFFNIAFFGIPIVTALFGSKSVSVLICLYLGSALYGDTIGYYQIAKTEFPKRQAWKKMLSIPFLYVSVAGIICKLCGLQTPELIQPAMSVISFTVSALGMAIVGFQLADIDFRAIRLPYYLKLLLVRTFAATAIMAVIIMVISMAFDTLSNDDLVMAGLVPLFPVAANITVFAAFLKADEEQSSLLVFFSLLLSLVLVSAAILVLEHFNLQG